MTWDTKRRGGSGTGADRGSGRAASPAPGKTTLTEQLIPKSGGTAAAPGAERSATSAPGKTTLTEQLRLKAPRAATPGAAEEAVASQGVAGQSAPFPHRSQIESSFGQPLAASAHTDESGRHASAQLGAQGFAFRGHVGFASESPSL